jgi:hypothetical protein
MDDSGVDALYQRVARLALLARFEADDSLAVAHRVAAAAARRASRGKRDQDSVMDRALASIANANAKPSKRRARRGRRRFGPVVPLPPPQEQAEVLGQLTKFNLSTRLGALLHLLEEVPIDEAARRVTLLGTATEARIRDAVERVTGDLTTRAIRDLLTGEALDPMRGTVSLSDVADAHRHRSRRALALGTVAVVALAAGAWWFGLRTPPLGTYAGDPYVRTQARDSGDLTVTIWPARGELLGDTTLLRSAADAWRSEGYPGPVSRPQVLFAGAVDHVDVVVMVSGDEIAVYQDGPRYAKHIWTSPFSQISYVSGIRLLTQYSQAMKDGDRLIAPVLLPPGATSAETGSMTGPASGWQPVPVDARGVAAVPMPQLTNDQRAQFETNGRSVAGGLRFTLPNILGHSDNNPITLADAYSSDEVILPDIEPSYDETQAGTPLSAADWCVAQQAAEHSNLGASYNGEELSDTASGPLPDGGGSGTLLDQTIIAGGFGSEFPVDGRMTDLNLVAASNGGCTVTQPPGTTDPATFALSRNPTWPAGSYELSEAVLWTSPAKKSYLVVGATAKAAGIRVSGTATGSVNGRWLVIPVPDTFNPGLMGLIVETVDGAGNVCGRPVVAGSSTTFCE